MATYCYIDDSTGDTVEKRFPLGTAPKLLTHAGREYRRDFKSEQGHNRRRNLALWPRKSDAAGVGIDQIDDAIAADKQMGCPIEYDRQTGQAVFENCQQEKKYLEAHGMYHLNSYGTSHDARRGGSN